MFQSSTGPLNKEPSTSSITEGQEGKTQFPKPTSEASALYENKESTFKEKLKRKKLEQQKELEKALKRKSDAEVEAQKRTKKNDHQKPPVEFTTLTGVSDQPDDMSSKAGITEVKTNSETAPVANESNTNVNKTDDAAASVEKERANEHPHLMASPPALGIPAFGESLFAASSFGSVAASTASPFTIGSSSGGDDDTTTNNPFAKSSSSGEAASAVTPFTKSSSGESGGSTFLNNMKAPGSSGSIHTLSFGPKANITLPIPTLTTPSAPSPFATTSEFRRTSASLPPPAKPLLATTSSAPPATDETMMIDVKEDDDEEEGQMEDVEG